MSDNTSPANQLPVRSPVVTFIFQLQIVVIVAFIVATLFTAWTPIGVLPGGISDSSTAFLAPQSTNQPAQTQPPRSSGPRIGIVAGHWGNDSGAVCSDGLTELDINLNVATLAKQKLVELGYEVDLLKEFDPLLTGYYANALVSVHSDSCDYINDQATGFKVAAALGTKQTQKDKSARLTACLISRYAEASGLPVHNSTTPDMTYYHAFDEIGDETTAAIIELGFMNLDRQKLTNEADQLAQGVVNGILCYLNNEDISADE
jgi:N-acetylmuramoyl-L-alanine amidase